MSGLIKIRATLLAIAVIAVGAFIFTQVQPSADVRQSIAQLWSAEPSRQLYGIPDGLKYVTDGGPNTTDDPKPCTEPCPVAVISQPANVTQELPGLSPVSDDWFGVQLRRMRGFYDYYTPMWIHPEDSEAFLVSTVDALNTPPAQRTLPSAPQGTYAVSPHYNLTPNTTKLTGELVPQKDHYGAGEQVTLKFQLTSDYPIPAVENFRTSTYASDNTRPIIPFQLLLSQNNGSDAQLLACVPANVITNRCTDERHGRLFPQKVEPTSGKFVPDGITTILPSTDAQYVVLKASAPNEVNYVDGEPAGPLPRTYTGELSFQLPQTAGAAYRYQLVLRLEDTKGYVPDGLAQIGLGNNQWTPWYSNSLVVGETNATPGETINSSDGTASTNQTDSDNSGSTTTATDSSTTSSTPSASTPPPSETPTATTVGVAPGNAASRSLRSPA